MRIILMPSWGEDEDAEAFPCNLASSSATRASSLSTVPLSWSTNWSPRGAIVAVYIRRERRGSREGRGSEGDWKEGRVGAGKKGEMGAAMRGRGRGSSGRGIWESSLSSATISLAPTS